jgi:hypothetical protein
MTAAWGIAEPPLRAAARDTEHNQCVIVSMTSRRGGPAHTET